MKAAGYKTWLGRQIRIAGRHQWKGRRLHAGELVRPIRPNAGSIGSTAMCATATGMSIIRPNTGGSATANRIARPSRFGTTTTRSVRDLAKCYTTDLFAARSKDWIAKHVQGGSKEPFFLYLAYDTPHAALQLPSVAFPEGYGLERRVAVVGKPGEMINTAAGTVDGYRHPDYTGKGWSDVEERFATMVRRIDHSIGDLLQTLRDLSIDENTLVVSAVTTARITSRICVTAKNNRVNYTPQSFQSYGPFDGTKRDVWEGGIRVGTLAWWPGKIAPGSISDDAVAVPRLDADVRRAGGIAPPARTDGVSLLPTLTGRGSSDLARFTSSISTAARRPSMEISVSAKRNQNRKQMQVVFVDGYKGVRVDIKDHRQPFAIYDLKKDPKELKNLAGSGPKFAALQKKMHDRVLQLRRPNPSAPRPYDDVPIPSVERAMQSGWAFDVYEGAFPLSRTSTT